MRCLVIERVSLGLRGRRGSGAGFLSIALLILYRAGLRALWFSLLEVLILTLPQKIIIKKFLLHLYVNKLKNFESFLGFSDRKK